MAEETDDNANDEGAALRFGKGMRVRVAGGDAKGTVGEIVWWGQSKYGPEMRAGVQPRDEESDKVWVDATDLRAIDHDGADLDPQPAIERPAPPKAKETREIDIPYDLARAMTALRLQRGYPASKADSATVRLDRLTQAEAEIGCSIPDAVVAYIVAALGSLREVGGVVGLTLELRAHIDEDVSIEEADHLAFDYDNADYLAFMRGDERDTLSFGLFLHEEGYEEAAPVSLADWLTDQLDGKISPGVQPFDVVVDYITVDEPEPAEIEETWISHAKFGRGTILSSEPTTKGDKLTIRFDEDGEVRKLLDRFVTYE